MHKNKKYIISFILLIISLYTIKSLLALNVLSLKYNIMIIIGIILSNILCLVIITRKSRVVRIIGYIIYIAFILLNLIGSYYLDKTDEFIGKAFGNNIINKNTYYVISKSNYNGNLEGDLYYYKDLTESAKALEHLEEYDIMPIALDNIEEVLDALISGTVNLGLIDSSSYEALFVGSKYDSKDFKIVYTFDIKNKVEKVNRDTKSVYNIYLQGKDFANLNDFNMIITVNEKTGKVLLTSIPRDLYIPVSGKGKRDNLSLMARYGDENSKKSLEDYFGIKFDYFIKINTEGVTDFVDTIGGITYCSDEEYTTTHALVLGTYNDYGKSKLHVKKGCQHLNGIETVTVARERLKVSGGDHGRQRNCQRILLAILDKVKSKDFIKNYSKVLRSLLGVIETDLSDEVLKSTIKRYLNKDEYTISTQEVKGYDTKDKILLSENFIGWVTKPYEENTTEVKNNIYSYMN